MSANGVLHNLGAEVVFTPLDKWEEEFNMYCRLMKIRTFSNFRKWKGFYVWHMNIIHKKRKFASRNLNTNMLLLNDILRDGLLNIQDMCYRFFDVTFTDVTVVENMWLFYFVENQVSIIYHVLRFSVGLLSDLRGSV